MDDHAGRCALSYPPHTECRRDTPIRVYPPIPRTQRRSLRAISASRLLNDIRIRLDNVASSANAPTHPLPLRARRFHARGHGSSSAASPIIAGYRSLAITKSFHRITRPSHDHRRFVSSTPASVSHSPSRK